MSAQIPSGTAQTCVDPFRDKFLAAFPEHIRQHVGVTPTLKGKLGPSVHSLQTEPRCSPLNPVLLFDPVKAHLAKLGVDLRRRMNTDLDKVATLLSGRPAKAA